MKKIIIFLSFLMYSLPCFAKGIPYVTNMPYKPYQKEICFNKIDTQSIEQNQILIVKNQFEFNKVKRLGNAYEYIILNNTGSDLKLKGVLAKDFFNRDINGDRNDLYKYMMQVASADAWRCLLPIYGQIYGFQMDAEKNPFIRSFPQDYSVRNGERIRILASAPLDINKPQADFIFLVNNQEQIIKF